MSATRIALSIVGLAGAAAKATGWGAVATACELALKAADVDAALRDIPSDPVRAAVNRVAARLADSLAGMQRRAGTPEADETEALLAAIDRAVVTALPSARHLVSGDLDFSTIQRRLQDAIARAEPDFFAPDRRGAQVLSQLLSTAFAALAEDSGFADAIRIPVAAETLQRLSTLQRGMERLPEEIAEKVAAAVDARGLERHLIIALARRLKPREVLNFDQAVTELEHAVDIAYEQIARGIRASNEDAFVGGVLARVAEATRRGELDRSVAAVDDALAELTRREAERQEQTRRDRVTLLEAGIAQDTLRRDAPAVARRIEALAVLEHSGDCSAWTPAFRRRWDGLYEEGRDKGISFSLEVAGALAQRMLSTARDAGERGAAGNLLGNALWTLGARESGTARLEQAVAAYRAALEEYTRERAPLNWATTQTNLGNALQTLGARESGTARLEQAVAAYRAALEERTRERVPLDWAMTQNNLGNALRTLGERESGTARLEQAVSAYRAALEEYTRERAPLDWATTQNNLGTALQTLGARESGTARLEQAVVAFRAALEECARERVPLDWAMTQNNLGNALQTLGERESGTARLEQAVSAYRAALEECTRERVPLNWAYSQHGLAGALATVATRLNDPAGMAAALEAMRGAAEVYRQAGNTYWLPIAERRIGEIEAQSAAMQQ